MRTNHARIAASAATLLAAIAAAGCSASAKDHTTTASTAKVAGALACDIRTSGKGGMTAMSAVVTSAGPASGSYTFRVRGGGTDIEQGGDFAVSSGSTSVGDVTLSRGSYDVTLTVDAGGKRTSCSKRIG